MYLDGFHIRIEQDRISKLQGRKLLEVFSAHGFENVYGTILKTMDEWLQAIPIRPLIETTGPEIFVSLDRSSVIVCKRPSTIESMRFDSYTPIEFVIVATSKKQSGLDALKDVCRSVFDATLYKGLFAELSAHAVLESTITGQSPSGTKLSNPAVRERCRELYNSLGKNVTPIRSVSGVGTFSMPEGLWLESLVADVIESFQERVHFGVQVGIDECDAVIAPFGRLTLIECKATNLKFNDIPIAKEKGSRMHADHLLFVVTNDHFHPNVKNSVHLWNVDQFTFAPDRTDPMPYQSAVIVRSEAQLRKFLASFLYLLKLDAIASWLLSEDSSSLIPWFSESNSWGVPVPYWRDWFDPP